MVHIKVHRKPKRRQISGLGNEIPLTHSTRWWLASLQNVLTCPLIRLNSMKYIRRVFHIEIYPWRCHAPARNGRRRRWGDQWRWRAVEDPQVACNWGMESHHITENPKKLMNKQNKPGGGGALNTVLCREACSYAGRLVHTLTLLYTIFNRRVLLSFCMTFIDKWYPFHIPSSECCTSFYLCCLCTVF